LEAFVDRTDASHGRECDRQIVGKSFGADKRDEQR
jgi:hypothetical protein